MYRDDLAAQSNGEPVSTERPKRDEVHAVERLSIDDVCEIVVTPSGESLPDIDGVDLFNRPAFFALHAASFASAYYYIARRPSSERPLAVCHVAETSPAHFRSPGRGSYGSIALLADADLAVAERMVTCIGRHLAARGAESIAMVLPPLDYHPANEAMVTNVLLRAGFSLAGHELSYALQVGNTPFVDGIDRGNRKRINAALREGLTFVTLPEDALVDAYRVIAENRAKKGYPLSMSLDALQDMAARFPGALRLAGVRDGDELIAASICVAVNAATLYVFYWGEIAGAERRSPVTLLASGLHAYCAAEGFTLLDVGTSTLGGEPNAGLIRYKTNLGCQPSLKLTFTRVLTR